MTGVDVAVSVHLFAPPAWLVTVCGVLASFPQASVLYNTAVLIKEEKSPRRV